jgi:D-tagatose-1,6-bisphosphate aldolase subunit GatZ/KbaZ
MIKRITEILEANKRGEERGIFSICSAHPMVIEASFEHSLTKGYPLLIESTSNQVDQFGGYTGMTPSNFREYIYEIARRKNFPLDNLILGGDHLGPNVWQKMDSTTAMKNASDQVAAYSAAGFEKLHIDTSMFLGNENFDSEEEEIKTKSKRAAELIEIAENKSSVEKIYIIGSDVPPPGGAKITDESNNEIIHITSKESIEMTLFYTNKYLNEIGLSDVKEKIAAIVVQPGVEFNNDSVDIFEISKAKEQVNFINNLYKIVYEAHSTDFQPEESLKQLVKNHYSILKVGPWLTYAYREALIGLENIEEILFESGLIDSRSEVTSMLTNVLYKNNKYWKEHYKPEDRINLIYSYSDRLRYYWNEPEIMNSVNKLIANLSQIHIPEILISQFLPNQYSEVASRKIENNPKEIIKSKIKEVLDKYSKSCGY